MKNHTYESARGRGICYESFLWVTSQCGSLLNRQFHFQEPDVRTPSISLTNLTSCCVADAFLAWRLRLIGCVAPACSAALGVVADSIAPAAIQIAAANSLRSHPSPRTQHQLTDTLINPFPMRPYFHAIDFFQQARRLVHRRLTCLVVR
jgi:hypothetical protein